MSKNRTSVVLAVGLGLCTTGCGPLWGDSGSTLVQVVTNHHGSMDEDGNYANHGKGSARSFTTDDGWRINLTTGYITTSALTLHDCQDQEANIPLNRGLVAEDLIYQEDLEKSAVGSITVPPIQLCGLTVHYGPFDPDESDSVPRSSAVNGTSIYLRGTAVREDGSSRTEFEIRVREEIEVDIDMSEMEDGEPMSISGQEAFPVEILISKTYDRFFDGIDFRTASEDDLEENVAAVLERETTLEIDR